MKTFILAWTAISIMAAAPVANAGECRYETDEIDSFTKEQRVATKALRLMSRFKVVLDKSKGHNSTIRVYAIREGEQTFLALEIRLRKTSAEEPSGEDLRNGLTIPKGAELLILMADRSIVSLCTSCLRPSRMTSFLSSDPSASTSNSEPGGGVPGILAKFFGPNIHRNQHRIVGYTFMLPAVESKSILHQYKNW